MAVLLPAPLVGNAALIHGSIDGVDLYYDDVLDITWLGNANLAATETFSLTQSTYLIPGAGEVGSTGLMNWNTANDWIAGMNAAAYLGLTGWMLPGLSPINGTNFQTDFSNNATTDRGYAKTGTDGGWRDGAGNPVSDMGHMYYVNLGNLGFCTPNDADPNADVGSCAIQPGWGLANTGLFTNLQPSRYWSEVAFGSTSAFDFDFNRGRQFSQFHLARYSVWAVHPGHVAAHSVPEPGTLVLLGIGLLGLLGVGRRRRL